MVNIKPIDLFSSVLPLGVLIDILVSLALYIARKEESLEKSWSRQTRVHMKDKLEQERSYAKELEKLQTLVQEKSIDQDTHARD